ncbi:hypothetical protein G6L37_00925 [Agrobacterium rubi]|nr:hypothetical protein [Agrobacterium rubi]NTF23954.1 hypothetical protein [Agrobacterium rubi]
MREEDLRLRAERSRVGASILIKMAIYLSIVSGCLVAFGFWETVLFLALLIVCGGRRIVSAVASRIVAKLPISEGPTVSEPHMAPGRRRKVRPAETLVIDLDPSEYSRTKV